MFLSINYLSHLAIFCYLLIILRTEHRYTGYYSKDHNCFIQLFVLGNFE